MIVTLPLSFKEAVAEFGIEAPDADEALDSPTFNVDLELLEASQISKLYDHLKKFPESRSIRVMINAFNRDQEAQGEMRATAFEQLASDLQKYLCQDATRGWLYRDSDLPQPQLVTGVDFYPFRKGRRKDEDIEEAIIVKTTTNHLGKTVHHSHRIEGGKGNVFMDPVQLLRHLHLKKETDELHQLYDEQLDRFRDIRPRYGEQLVLVRDHAMEVDDPENENRSYYNRKPKKKVNAREEGLGKLVHNQPMENARFSVAKYNQPDPNQPYLALDLRAYIKKFAPKGGTAFTRAPHDMTFKCYHLGQHSDVTVHVMEVEVYKYDEKIRQNLVLPGMYNEVLDVLTHDMTTVSDDDAIKGKSGGNVILLAGPPGLGKTLTAEIYAEFRKVPLLKVHSGQLGTTAESIENHLLHFFKLAKGWGIPILLDEFDVFGRARADSLLQNAVVAVFLRTLEYQSNTLFLTTNRADTMDDAILSRCMAIIRYELPHHEELRQIWKTLRNIIIPELKDDVIDATMEHFISFDKKMSGRDVKNILRLAARYALTGKPVTKELLITCAGFRGV